jgi:hypothetical protein
MDEADQRDRFAAFAAQQRRANFARPPGIGSIWKIAGVAALALVVYGGIRLWPDFVRYQKIRNM